MLLDIWEFHVLLEMLKVESTSFKRYRNISSNFEISFPFLNYSFKYTVTLATPEGNEFSSKYTLWYVYKHPGIMRKQNFEKDTCMAF